MIAEGPFVSLQRAPASTSRRQSCVNRAPRSSSRDRAQRRVSKVRRCGLWEDGSHGIQRARTDRGTSYTLSEVRLTACRHLQPTTNSGGRRFRQLEHQHTWSLASVSRLPLRTRSKTNSGR
jgi:hypothetical protein